MIENIDPSSELLAHAPAVTAVVYTGAAGATVALADLALGVETGEIVPLGSKLFSGNAKPIPPAPDGGAEQGVAIEVAGLLRCDPDASVLGRVALLALRQAENAVAERCRQSDHADSEPQKKPETDPMSGSMEALIAAMDAAEAAHTGSITT